MATEPVHLLLGPHGDWKQAHVACGARYFTMASWDLGDVTCPACRLGRQRVQAEMPEEQLQERVRELAEQYGWRYFHVYDSRKSPEGWPDTVLLKGERAIIAELKSATGIVTEAQHAWLTAWGQVQHIACHVWRPEHLQEIETLLRT
jgi:hypothetical protein